MKNSKRTLALSSVILALSLAPAVSFAEFMPSDSEALTGVHTEVTGIGVKIDAVKAEIAKGGAWSRKDAAAAIINDEADARLKEYELNEELRFMQAPGLEFAINTGKAVGEADAVNRAQELVDGAFEELISEYWPTEAQIVAQNLETVFSGERSPLSITAKSPREIMYEQYFSEGQPPVNIGEVIRLNKTTPELAKEFIKIVVGPETEINANAAAKMKKIEVMGYAGDVMMPKEKEDAANTMVDAVNMSPSTNIISGILSRRLLSEENQDNDEALTVMQALDKHVNDRFQNTTWYANIGKSSDSALLREITHMMAFNSWLQHQSFLLQEQEASALAIMNANFSRLYNVMKGLSEKLDDDTDAEANRANVQSQQALDEGLENLEANEDLSDGE